MTVLGWVLVIVGCVLGLIIGIIALLLVGLFTLVKHLDGDPAAVRHPQAPGAPLTVPISSLVITVKESAVPVPAPSPARLIKKRTP